MEGSFDQRQPKAFNPLGVSVPTMRGPHVSFHLDALATSPTTTQATMCSPTSPHSGSEYIRSLSDSDSALEDEYSSLSSTRSDFSNLTSLVSSQPNSCQLSPSYQPDSLCSVPEESDSEPEETDHKFLRMTYVIPFGGQQVSYSCLADTMVEKLKSRNLELKKHQQLVKKKMLQGITNSEKNNPKWMGPDLRTGPPSPSSSPNFDNFYGTHDVLQGKPIILKTLEKGVEYPVVQVSSVDHPSHVLLHQLQLMGHNLIMQEAVYQQIDQVKIPVITSTFPSSSGWVPSSSFLCCNSSANRCTASPSWHHPSHSSRDRHIFMGLKRLDPYFINELEENWKDLTGARMILLDLPTAFGLERVTFYKRVRSSYNPDSMSIPAIQDTDTFIHVMIARLTNINTILDEAILLDFVHRLRLKMMGYVAVYTPFPSYPSPLPVTSTPQCNPVRGSCAMNPNEKSRFPPLLNLPSPASPLSSSLHHSSSFGSSVPSSASTMRIPKRAGHKVNTATSTPHQREKPSRDSSASSTGSSIYSGYETASVFSNFSRTSDV